jgi:hypothetical protein
MFNKIKDYALRFIVIYAAVCIVLYPFTDVFDVYFTIGMVMGVGLAELHYQYEKRKEKAKYNIKD